MHPKAHRAPISFKKCAHTFGITVHGQDGLLSTGSAKLRSLGVHQTQIWGGLVVARV